MVPHVCCVTGLQRRARAGESKSLPGGEGGGKCNKYSMVIQFCVFLSAFSGALPEAKHHLGLKPNGADLALAQT